MEVDPHHLRRRRGGRLGRDAHQPGLGRLSDHQFDHDGRRLQCRGDERRPNLWGDQLVFVEPESEHSAATFCEGFAAGRGPRDELHLGPGLVLMKEVLYTISGKRLPVVFNIGARALTSQG
jgi:hypothetical protein